MSRKLLGDFAALLVGLQCPIIVKQYKKKKGRKKERNKEL